MRSRTLFLLTAFMSASLMGISAQSEKTIEELYLQKSIESIIIEGEAYSDSEELKKIALKDIEQMIDDGRISDTDTHILNILDDLAKEGLYNKKVRNGIVVNDYIEVRMESCKLLGSIGGEIARDTLIDVIALDHQITVKSEAIVAISKIPLDEDDEVLESIYNAIYIENQINKDNNFAYATLIAMENIAKNNNGIPVRDTQVRNNLIQAISYIASAESGYIPAVRKKAISTLQFLRDF